MEKTNISRRTSGSLRKERERERKRERKKEKRRDRAKRRDRVRIRKTTKTKNGRPVWVNRNKVITFSRFDYPTPPTYLGFITISVCGYYYNHCRSGILVKSRNFLKFPVKETLRSRVYTMLLCFEHHPRLNRLGDEKRMIASYLASPCTLEDCRWLQDLVKLSKNRDNRPSETHFPIVFWGCDSRLGKYVTKTDRFASYNPQAPIPLEAWWTNRWPSHEEAMILEKYFGGFSMGKPPKVHLHGN